MFFDFIKLINDYLWSVPIIILCLGAGLYLTIRLRGVQVRMIPTQIGLLFNGKASDQGMSSFQAFCLAIACRVGTGNIAGVATAIAAGGPGALFWMWVMAFIGAGTAFVENTLAQLYKGKVNGEYRGGIAYYISRGFNKKILGYIFACIMILATLSQLGVQSHEISTSVQNAFGVPPWITGIVVVVLLGFIIFGGSKRIAAVANYVVPFMALAYILLAIIILIANANHIPETFATIFKSAFGAGPIGGGMMGSAVLWGVRRGVYSNEAGEGTSTQSAAAAEVSHPAKQGLVQSFSVYVDTLFVCTATGLMLIVTGAYNVIAPDGGYLVHNLSTEAGAQWTQAAVDSLFPFGAHFVALAIFFFAFTTVMTMFYNCETSMTYFFHEKGNMSAKVRNILRIVILALIYHGTTVTGSEVWALGDTGAALLIWGNVICLLLLSGKAITCLKDFEKQKKQGFDPIFNPADHPELGDLPIWEEAYKGYTSGELKN